MAGVRAGLLKQVFLALSLFSMMVFTNLYTTKLLFAFKTFQGLVTDATTAIEYLLNRNDINHRKILVFGRSLGGAVAISSVTSLLNDSSRVLHPTISNKNLVIGVILENTFTSIVDMGVEILKTSLIYYVPSFLVKNKVS